MASPLSTPSPGAPPPAPSVTAPLPSGAPQSHPPSAPPPSRPLGRRPGLPNGRAIIGGFLVMVAAVATFAAISTASQGPSQTYVVTQGELRAGERLEPGDLRVVVGELPDDVAAQTFAALAELDGAVLLTALDGDQLVTRSAVRRASDPEGAVARTHELSFSLDRSRALAGHVQKGELVDVLATYGTGADAYTSIVARRVRLIAVDDSDQGTISSGAVTLTVALRDESEVLETTHAIGVAEITVARATGADENEPAEGPYRPPPFTPDRSGTSGSSSSTPGSTPSTTGVPR